MTTLSPARAIGHISLENVSVRFRRPAGGDIVAVSPTSLDFGPGSFTSLIGPSGCGKSTLLNVVAGFVKATEGVARVDGRTIAGPGPDVGIVFQQYALFPWLTALKNVMFGMKRLPLSAAERRGKALDALAEVGLRDRADQYPGQLSGGMKQRVAIARTLAALPRVLLMDEPFGALDSQARLSMQELLLRMWDLHRITVLFVTHDAVEALLLSDRIHVMSRGPGRVVETIEVDDARPRAIERLSGSFVRNRQRILELLRASQRNPREMGNDN